ncbi:17980_t:CDS:2, partial [Racocetra fulgida]
FLDFFQNRKDTFALGVCNGCQFLSQLKELIPGTENWPLFKRNKSEQFEARCRLVEITSSSRAEFSSNEQLKKLIAQGLVAVRFVDNYGNPTEKYPYNPNGSPLGITGIQTPNGRVLGMMPHPERVILKEANSWYPVEE